MIISRDENYIVIQRAVTADFIRGSVPERCFICRHGLMLTPSGQDKITELRKTEPHKQTRIICFPCYSRAPDKNYIRPTLQQQITFNRVQQAARRHKF